MYNLRSGAECWIWDYGLSDSIVADLGSRESRVADAGFTVGVVLTAAHTAQQLGSSLLGCWGRFEGSGFGNWGFKIQRI